MYHKCMLVTISLLDAFVAYFIRDSVWAFPVRKGEVGVTLQ